MKKLKLLFILLLGFTFTTVIKAETSLPSPTLSITGEFDEERGVYTSDVVINLSVENSSASIEYKLFETNPPTLWTRYKGPIPIQRRGNYRLVYRSYLGDNLGREQAINIRIDIPQDEEYPNVIRNGTIINHRGTNDPIILPKYEERDAEIRGVWVSTVSNIDIGKHITDELYKNEIISILNNVQKQNMNTVFFQVRPMNDAFYPSELAPYSEYIKGRQGEGLDWDILEFVIEESHKRGLELHAWMNPYRVANIPEHSPATKEEVLRNLDDKNFAKQNPEYTLMQTTGRTLILDPGQPAVREYLLDVIEEILVNYDVDGIHFDDYFYVPTLEDNQTFLDYNEEQFPSISDWRRENVNKLVKSVNDLVKDFNTTNQKHVKFGISPVAIWRNGTQHGGSNTSGYSAYDSLYADTKKWVTEEWLDYILPQVYFDFSLYAAPFATIVDWWVDVIETSGVDVDLVIGIGFYRYTDNTPWVDENIVAEQLRYINQYDVVKGSVMFSYRTFNRSLAPINKTIERLNNFYWSKPVDFSWDSDVAFVPMDDEQTIALKNELNDLIKEINNYIENKDIKADTGLSGNDLVLGNFYTSEEALAAINNAVISANNVVEARVLNEAIIAATIELQNKFNNFKETVYEGSFDPNRESSVNTLLREIDIILSYRNLLHDSQGKTAEELPVNTYFADREYLNAIDEAIDDARAIIADETSVSSEIDEVYRNLKEKDSALRNHYFKGENENAEMPDEVVLITFKDGDKILTKNAVVGSPIERPLTPYKEGKLFKGWYLEDNKYDFNQLAENELTLKAKWEDLGNLENISIYEKTEFRNASKNVKEGLRYQAIVNEKFKNNEHGFYLVYGTTSLEELQSAIFGNGIINGKKVIKVVVKDFTDSNTYSVVLTGIPEKAYDDVITVVPYVMDGENAIFAEEFQLSSVNHALELEQIASLKKDHFLYEIPKRRKSLLEA